MNEDHDRGRPSDSAFHVNNRGKSSRLMGAGVVAAGGAVAGAAVGTFVGGPFGALVCGLIGATTGGLAGKHLTKIDRSSADIDTIIRPIQPISRMYEPRRLSIPQLRTYIRGGCFCSVCELARAEIRVLERAASSEPGARPGHDASPDGWHQDFVASLAEDLDLAMEHIRGPAGLSLKTVDDCDPRQL